jgi:hypothetical protein
MTLQAIDPPIVGNYLVTSLLFEAPEFRSPFPVEARAPRY